MKQTAKIISTYTGDTSGVCSALFELGGLIVMHDPSGCNSTYSTHDEPRWYDMDSLVFISGLTEKDAIFGNDEKVISDTVRAAEELNPRFIAIAGSPIPYLTGCDLNAVAAEIENRTGIPTLGFETDGMRSYIHGASIAFREYTRRMCNQRCGKVGFGVNLLGVTPLDFSVNGSVDSIRKLITDCGMNINAVMAMGSTVSEIDHVGDADVNLVVSSCGIESAELLKERFGIPYIVGTPYGKQFSQFLMNTLNNKSNFSFTSDTSSNPEIIIIGESINSLSLSEAIRMETKMDVKVVSPVDTPRKLISKSCISATYEDEIIPIIQNCRNIIADPMYLPICPASANFISLPHEAFSGRIYRDKIPNLIGNIDYITSKIK